LNFQGLDLGLHHASGHVILPCMTDKADATLGWMIEVSERRLGGNPVTRRYYVAVPDESDAILMMRRASEIVNPTVRSKRRITDPKVFSLLNVNPGSLLQVA